MDLGRRVDHANVVRTVAAGDVADVHYLALEFVPGKTLRQLVTQNGPLSVGDAARVGADIAAGLAHVHERGLVHRDVKPGNIMVRPDGRAVLLDFGLALAPGEPLPDDPAVAGGRGYVVGTMDFLAPEQAKNAVGVGPAADLYALGCTLYFALSGALPYPAEGAKAKVLRHRDDPIPTIPTGPPEFAALVKSLMAKKPAGRPASAARVRELLLPWATAARGGAAIDALAAADEPGIDSVLWEAAPGDELPVADFAEPESNPFARLEDSDSASESEVEEFGQGNPTVAWLLLGLLVCTMGLIILVAAIRRL
jgi:serine/threonine protein kinase